MSFYCDFSGPIVSTRAGKLRGYMMDGVYCFRGIMSWMLNQYKE